jgi:ketosteroid isomerase-like protein
MKTNHPDIIGQKAMIESSGSATQKNGQPYTQKWVMIIYTFSNHVRIASTFIPELHLSYAFFFIFSEKTGKITEIREYYNTVLTQEVFKNN